MLQLRRLFSVKQFKPQLLTSSFQARPFSSKPAFSSFPPFRKVLFYSSIIFKRSMSNSSVWPWTLRCLNPTSPTSSEHDVGSVLHTWDLTPDAIESEAAKTIELARTAYDAVGSLANSPDGELSYDAVIKSLAEAERFYGGRKDIIDLYMNVSDSKAVRDAAMESRKKLNSFSTKMLTREDVYKVLKRFEQLSGGSLAAQPRRFLERSLLRRRKLGLDLPRAEDRNLVAELTLREKDLGTAYEKNLAEDNTTLEFTPEELDGVPAETLAEMARSEDGGKLRVTLQYPHFFPVMRFCKVRATRAALERAFNARCMEANVPILHELIRLRHKRAKLVGFETHAEYMLCERMAKTPVAVRQLLDTLASKLQPLLEKELERIGALIAEDLQSSAPPPTASTLPPLLGVGGETLLSVCDSRYYMDRVTERHYAVDSKLLRDYFPLQHVLRLMLATYQRILGLKFEELTKRSDVKLWHQDVQLFQVNDCETNELMGYFYMDLYPREGKYGHAMVTDIQQSVLLPDGRRQLPVAAMVCNFPRPTESTPSLLPHDDVETLFHEFGHMMHVICARPDFEALSAFSVECDFIEMPSQMFENWVWDARMLGALGRHYQTGQPLPAPLLESLVRSRVANAALMNMRQITLSRLDLDLHHNIALGKGIEQELEFDSAQHYTKLSAELSRTRVTPNTNMAGSFAHMARGYDSQYYGYLWSEVFSSEMYASRFEQPAERSAEEVEKAERDAGRHLRRTVFEPGATRDAADLLHNFLGRQPDKQMRAFLRFKGVPLNE